MKKVKTKSTHKDADTVREKTHPQKGGVSGAQSSGAAESSGGSRQGNIGHQSSGSGSQGNR
jgi:hypothetical protein